MASNGPSVKELSKFLLSINSASPGTYKVEFVMSPRGNLREFHMSRIKDEPDKR